MIYRLLKTLLSYYDSILMNYFSKLQLELISAGVGAPSVHSRVVARIYWIFEAQIGCSEPHSFGVVGSFSKLVTKRKNPPVANSSWAFEERCCSLLTECRLFKQFGEECPCVYFNSPLSEGGLQCSAVCCKVLVFLPTLLFSCAETAQRAAVPLRHSPGWHLLKGRTI